MLTLALATAGMALPVACRTPLPASIRRTEELRTVGEDRVIAFLTPGHLALRFRLKGRDSYAEVPLASREVDSQAAMEFSRGARDLFAASKRSGQPVPVAGPAVWRELSRDVAAALAPASPRQGVLVTTGSLELIVCRNAAGSPTFFPLTERPRGMKIVRRIAGKQLVAMLTSALQQRHPCSGPVLLLTGQAPAMLLFDTDTPRVTFVSVPTEQMVKLPILGSSPDVAFRGLLSVGLRSGVITTLKNPVTTAVHGTANLISMADAAIHGLLAPLPSGPPPPLARHEPMNLTEWERRLDRITGEAHVPATVRLRIGGEQFFPDLIEAIQEARESIDIQIYIFDSDDYALQIADLLKARSHEVKVRVMIDEAASIQSSLLPPASPLPPGHRAPSSIVDYLRKGSKIDVRPMAMAALSASHTKMIIIDGKRGWLGGMNIGREYRSDWHDMMIEVSGPVIGWMQRNYTRAWAHNGWTGDLGDFVTRFLSSRRAAAAIRVPEGAIPVRPLRSSAVHSDLKDARFAAVRNARQSIWIENAYITDSRFIHALINARYRGVDVRVILPEENDSPLMRANNKALIPLLLRHGIRVYLLPEMSHIKAAIYDGWACIGSANFDRLSFHVNHEFDIGYSDPAAVGTLRRDLFLKDMARASEAKTPPPGSFASQLTDSLLLLLGGQF